MEVESVKNAKEFECLMERRRKEYEKSWRAGYNQWIAVDENGAPKTPDDKRVMCEMQKLAVGSETAYMLCGAPYQGFRKITIYVQGCDTEFFDEFFCPQILGNKRSLKGVGFCGESSGVACAFPGGCD